MAIMALVRLGPKNAASAMARIKKGAASRASVQREITASVQPPKYPAMMPKGTPRPSAIATETTPASKEACAPQIRRDSTSRPNSSVPSQCAAEGALRTAPQSVAEGSGIGRMGASNAIAQKKTTSTPPSMALRWLRNFFQTRFSGRAERTGSAALSASMVMGVAG